MAYLDPGGNWQVLNPPSASSVLTHPGTPVGAPPAWTTKSGLLVASDLPSHDHTRHDNRTRRTAGFSPAVNHTWVTDAHGGVIGSVAHYDVTAAQVLNVYYDSQPMPNDYVSANVTLTVLCSSDVASNNVYAYPFLETLVAGTTGEVQDPNPGYTAYACSGTANRPFVIQTTSATPPASGGLWIPTILWDRNNAADTNTGVLSVWGCWIEYTADM